VSRALNILPCVAVVNWLRLPERRMPARQQFMLWWSGLRGAMAFALAIDAAASYGEAGEVMKVLLPGFHLGSQPIP
jgi:NhaP-type Na+/H+ or K+/H+ antiporter